MIGYRRMRKGDPNPVHFSPTELAKCPIKLTEKKEGKYIFKPSEKLSEIFETGNYIHICEGQYRNHARGLIDTELHLTVIRKDLKCIFSGYMDFLMIDERGMYIEDLKSCNRNAFYHFNSDPNSFSEKIQVSAYRWLYYQVHGVIIDRAVITKIDRENPRNRIALEIPMYSIDSMDDFIWNHPSIAVATGDPLTDQEFRKRTEKIIRKNRWVCRYCEDNKECKLNIKLTREEKVEKLKAKKGKETFAKLVK